MTWQQPQLADPLMGPTDEIRKLQHRLLYAYPANSHAHTYGVIESGLFDAATDKALRDIQAHLGGAVNAQPGVLTYDTKVALGVVVLPPKAPTKRFVQQGVGFDTSAFLMGNVGHSYNMAVAECIAEMNRLALPLYGVPKVVIGYSMGDDAQNQWLLQWPADRRAEIKLVVGFGSPSRPPGPTLLGNNPQGQGISGIFTPDWCRDRTYLFINDGDMYPEAVGLLPWFYQILTRMAVSLDFASYLFGMLTSAVGGQLLGTVASSLPFAGILAPIAGLVTAGPVTKTSGPILSPLSLLAMLPQVVQTLGALLKFVSTNAHYHYHDQPRDYWRGLTAVDCAAQIIAEKVDTAVVYTVPGTVDWWNSGPPAWTAWKLP
ncbi:putative peptidoglycan binding domain protein [uncultured Mycobacterium sp.]|uniref:Putative peptidoglycan binding domain protein n=1 Tax=uncultured Mycobacterium sp. TaxID=171292 RepID=A0A1Y5P519_9MYCO|nr:putative peptidoglycan binding domain protein [uncultured Mycobacterium sp.]